MEKPEFIPLKAGDRVKRGPEWNWGDQDVACGGTGVGTVLDSDEIDEEPLGRGQYWVRWDGSERVYYYPYSDLERVDAVPKIWQEDDYATELALLRKEHKALTEQYLIAEREAEKAWTEHDAVLCSAENAWADCQSLTDKIETFRGKLIEKNTTIAEMTRQNEGWHKAHSNAAQQIRELKARVAELELIVSTNPPNIEEIMTKDNPLYNSHDDLEAYREETHKIHEAAMGREYPIDDDEDEYMNESDSIDAYIADATEKRRIAIASFKYTCYQQVIQTLTRWAGAGFIAYHLL